MRIAAAAKGNASTSWTAPWLGTNQRGTASSASPSTPPRPVGSGQCAVAGSREASAAAEIDPPSHSAARNFGRSSRRLVSRRHPQKAGGASTAMEASPSICMSVSETMAPGQPARLRIGAPVA